MSDELRLMSIHAHADDETITMGGLLATCADRGIRTCNICCTDGKLATIVAADMPEETTRPHLAEIRQQELRAAIHELKGSKPAIVQIERQGQYVYIEREFEERRPASGTDRVGKHEAEPGPQRH